MSKTLIIFVSILCFLLGQVSPIAVYAAADSPLTRISKLEDLLDCKTSDNEPVPSRMANLEQHVFGRTMHGSLLERLCALEFAVTGATADQSPEPVPATVAPGISQSSFPKGDDGWEEDDSFSGQRPAGAMRPEEFNDDQDILNLGGVSPGQLPYSTIVGSNQGQSSGYQKPSMMEKLKRSVGPMAAGALMLGAAGGILTGMYFLNRGSAARPAWQYNPNEIVMFNLVTKEYHYPNCGRGPVVHGQMLPLGQVKQLGGDPCYYCRPEFSYR